MSSDLTRGKTLDDAPGVIGVSWGAGAEFSPLPDAIATDPRAGLMDPRRWFAQHPNGSGARFEIEVGCGKGTFILEQSGQAPTTNFLGIEWAFEYYLYTADRLRRAQRRNVRMLKADASEFLRWRCTDACVDVIHLYFSDPWPKPKHHKNRVVQHRFLAEAWRVLVPGGELRVVTDHDELWAWDMEHFAPWTSAQHWASVPQPLRDLLPPTWRTAPPFSLEPFLAPDWVGDGMAVGTNYERKMCAGKPAHACVLRKHHVPPAPGHVRTPA